MPQAWPRCTGADKQRACEESTKVVGDRAMGPADAERRASLAGASGAE